MKSSFSVVVISYNGKTFLEKFLLAIRKSTIKPEKIIVVDDFSNDGTEQMIKEKFSYVEFIRNNRNLGPAVSRNRGAVFATGNYIIFLDNDVLVRPDTFEKLINFFKSRHKVGIVGAKIIPKGKEKMWWNMGYDFNHFRISIGYLFGFLLRMFPKSELLKSLSMKFILNYWDYDRIIEVDWVVEMCFIVKREAFGRVSGLDENFFFYHEGPDFCKRIRSLGYKVYFYPEAVVDALEGHTHTQWRRKKEFLKSEYYYYQKHYFYKKSNPFFFFVGRIISSFLYLIA